MPTANCSHCNHDHDWNWEEAFDKFGFDDGDGLVMTDVVETVLSDAGYSVKMQIWGMHNTVILSIKGADDIERIPSTANLGYDEPREYLPQTIIDLLDADPRTGDGKEVRS